MKNRFSRIFHTLLGLGALAFGSSAVVAAPGYLPQQVAPHYAPATMNNHVASFRPRYRPQPRYGYQPGRSPSNRPARPYSGRIASWPFPVSYRAPLPARPAPMHRYMNSYPRPQIPWSDNPYAWRSIPRTPAHAYNRGRMVGIPNFQWGYLPSGLPPQNLVAGRHGYQPGYFGAPQAHGPAWNRPALNPYAFSRRAPVAAAQPMARYQPNFPRYAQVPRQYRFRPLSRPQPMAPVHGQAMRMPPLAGTPFRFRPDPRFQAWSQPMPNPWARHQSPQVGQQNKRWSMESGERYAWRPVTENGRDDPNGRW